MDIKDSRTLRIYFQNINGLPVNDNWAEWNHISSYLKDNKVDISGFAETNINWNKQLESVVKRHLLAHIKPATVQTSSCYEPSKYTYQRGGVLMTTIGNMTGRTGEAGEDPLGLGRWTFTKYLGRQGKTLIVATAYRVAQNALTTGDNTAYNQQYRALRRKG